MRLVAPRCGFRDDSEVDNKCPDEMQDAPDCLDCLFVSSRCAVSGSAMKRHEAIVDNAQNAF